MTREARCREDRAFELRVNLCHPNSGVLREVSKLKLVIQPLFYHDGPLVCIHLTETNNESNSGASA